MLQFSDPCKIDVIYCYTAHKFVKSDLRGASPFYRHEDLGPVSGYAAIDLKGGTPGGENVHDQDKLKKGELVRKTQQVFIIEIKKENRFFILNHANSQCD